jgi:hypothetical protein
MHFPTASCSLLTRKLENLPQHPVSDHHQPMFHPSRERPTLTPREIDRKNYANRFVDFIRRVLHSERKEQIPINGRRYSPGRNTRLISSCVQF